VWSGFYTLSSLYCIWFYVHNNCDYVSRTLFFHGSVLRQGSTRFLRSTTFSRLFCVWRPESASLKPWILNFNMNTMSMEYIASLLTLCSFFIHSYCIVLSLLTTLTILHSFFVCFSYVPHFLSNQLLDIDFEVVISLHQSYVFKLNNLPILLLFLFLWFCLIASLCPNCNYFVRWITWMLTLSFEMSMSADSYFWICNLFVSNCILFVFFAFVCDTLYVVWRMKWSLLPLILCCSYFVIYLLWECIICLFLMFCFAASCVSLHDLSCPSRLCFAISC